MSMTKRSACARTMLSTSRRTPSATPAASFIIRPTLSNNLLLAWAMWRLHSKLAPIYGPRPGLTRVGGWPIGRTMPFPNISPIALELGPFAVRWYALAYLAGVFVGAWYATTLLRRKGLWANDRPPFE